jgi:O-antigen ligase
MSYAERAEWWRPEIAPRDVPLSQPEDRAGRQEIAGSRASFRALMAFTFVLLLAPQAFIPALAALRPGLLTAAAALTAYLFDRLFYRQPVVMITREMIAAGCLAAWALVTVPTSYWPGGSLAVLLDEYLKTLVIFWLLGNVVNTSGRLQVVARGLTLMAVPLAVVGIHQYVAGMFLDGRILSYDAPLASNPNDLALILNLILPLTLALALLQTNILLRLFFLGCAGLSAMGVILTFSRAGFISLATTALIYFVKLMRRPGRAWVLGALCLALASVPFLPSGYAERLGTIMNIQSDPTGSAQERWGDTLAAIQFVSRNPIIGAGIGMNILALNEVRGAIWKKVHNVYLEYATDLGLPGLILFLVILTGCFRSATYVMRRTAGSPPLRDLFLLAEGIQVSLSAFTVAAFFHPVAYNFYFYYMGGLALAARNACGAEARG